MADSFCGPTAIYNHPVAARMTHFCELACKVTEKDFSPTATVFFFFFNPVGAVLTLKILPTGL